ncbi:HtaA domain-containing protein [Streptomyces sp. NBC_00554]|uniref:HtaA domain-containing protein n=1 Tax=Streptomyces sp. NBC_00554 TaxID=2903661 RepID=UPI00352DC200|nr:HtaA domain-containing protein [Streptomyces sp. NBC_00554]
MRKRPSAVVLAGGALFALLCPGMAAAQDGDAFPREVSGGYVSWATASAALSGHGVSLDAVAPAVRGSADRTWFPATGGGTDPGTGDADIDLGGTARLTGSAEAAGTLLLDDLRLSIEDGGGALYVRTELDGQERDFALAGVRSDGAEPAVRDGGVTWTGLRASLTDEGARLLSTWSGQRFAAGDGLGTLDVTVGTGSTGGASEKPAQPDEAPQASPGATAPDGQQAAPEQTADGAGPSAAVALADLTAGAEQGVTGEGFEPGEVVLVAIDEDTRYQTVADAEGRVSRTFPVYASAVEGAHTVELYTVNGARSAVAQFLVRAAG